MQSEYDYERWESDMWQHWYVHKFIWGIISIDHQQVYLIEHYWIDVWLWFYAQFDGNYQWSRMRKQHHVDAP